MSVGENIKARRKQLGISAETLAEMLGLSPSTVYRYESGDINKVDAAKLIPIADALNTSPGFLMGWDVEEPTPRIQTLDNSARRTISTDVDYNFAAVKAMETLIKYRVCTAPILPLHILKHMPGVIVASFTEMADREGLDRDNLVVMFGAESQDAVTYVHDGDGLRYVVAYNQRLPFYMLQRSLAREVGHIVLWHTVGALDERQITEAMYFARYLLCPRPLIKAIMESGTPLTIEVCGNITGCYGRALAGIRKTPGAHIPAELNRKVRALFADYLRRFAAYQSIMPVDPEAALADFGTFMDNYEE